MTAKEYLSQARHFDLKINSKLEHLNSLSDLANKCTSHISGMPGSPLSSKSLMADAINKVIDLQNEIAEDIKKLVEIKDEILKVIQRVDDVELQIILEKRYLCCNRWEDIAFEMRYSMQHTFRMHTKALKKVGVILKDVIK